MLDSITPVRRLFSKDKVSKPKSDNALSIGIKFSQGQEHEKNDSNRNEFFPMSDWSRRIFIG